MSEGDTAFGDSNTSEDFAKEDSSGGEQVAGFTLLKLQQATTL